jgi:pyruvate-ferredoxin/flavodoxin oxidoreductase
VQEAHDMALIAQAATLEARVPFIHFFDGFRTSHEVNKLTLLSDDEIRAMIRRRPGAGASRPGAEPRPAVHRGTAQNPDVYFQAAKRSIRSMPRCPGIVQAAMDKFAGITGRRYNLFDYVGDPNAERVVILMGSGAETACETADYLNARGEKVGVLQVRLYQPLSASHFLAALPASVKSIAVLERTKEPGATGEPMYLEVVSTLVEAQVEPEPCRRRSCRGSSAAATACRPRNSRRRCARRCSTNCARTSPRTISPSASSTT